MNELGDPKMRLLGIFIVMVCFICERNTSPVPLQGFEVGDQTTGSKWPPYENAGQDYWSLNAGNINLNEDAVEDGKQIVKKGIKEESGSVSVKNEEKPKIGPIYVQSNIKSKQTLKTASRSLPYYRKYARNARSYGIIPGRLNPFRNYYPKFLY